VCYELAADFVDLYRGYGGGGAEGTQLADSSKRKTIGAFQTEPSSYPAQTQAHPLSHSECVLGAASESVPKFES
jgi:hypothetical protein